LVANPEELESLLSNCWGELAGEQGGMSAYKLIRRTEQMEWNSPLLTFEMERHGGTVLGSVYAEIQAWTVDINRGSAEVSQFNPKRLVGKRQPPLNVNPIATEIVSAILAEKMDDRLKWYGPTKVRVLIASVIPSHSAAKETVAGRRKRLGAAIGKLLDQHGWRKVGQHRYEKSSAA